MRQQDTNNNNNNTSRTEQTALFNHTAGGYVRVGLAPEAGSALFAIIAFPRLIARHHIEVTLDSHTLV